MTATLHQTSKATQQLDPRCRDCEGGKQRENRRAHYAGGERAQDTANHSAIPAEGSQQLRGPFEPLRPEPRADDSMRRCVVPPFARAADLPSAQIESVAADLPFDRDPS
jgi:hypothetical protein